MSAPQVRQRGARETPKKASTTAQDVLDVDVPELKAKVQSSITSEWDYKLVLAVITAAAFITRFWGIGHPNEVVFDEVHFGKVRGDIPSGNRTSNRADLASIVRLVLPAKNLFLRCSPSFR